MTTPASPTMTENEFHERADAQVETCLACHFLNLGDDGRWFCSNSRPFSTKIVGVWGKCYVANNCQHYAAYNGGELATLYLSDPCPAFRRVGT